MTVLISLLGLIFLIVIHELGHMLTAKALGVRVDEFGVGFGPPIFKRKFGETVYSFRIILLGGFAKMAGMEDIGSVKQARGELALDSYPAKAAWRRALIIFAGPAANLVACVLILAGGFMISGIPTEFEPEVAATSQNSLAEEVGIREGDRILEVGGQQINSWEGFQDVVSDRSPGDEVSLVLGRGGERVEVSGELSADPADPDRALVGVSPVVSERSHSPLLALGLGAERTAQITVAYLGGLFQLVTGQLNFFENVNGPVGIVSISSEAVSGGFYIQFLAFISLVLAIMNLLPILPLDGGHLLFIAIEKVIGRPVSGETMGKVAFLGIALFLTIFLLATYTDISTIVSGQPFIPE